MEKGSSLSSSRWAIASCHFSCAASRAPAAATGHHRTAGPGDVDEEPLIRGADRKLRFLPKRRLQHADTLLETGSEVRFMWELLRKQE